MNAGKQFEEDFRKSFEKLKNVSIDRLYDPVGGYSGIKNICDFICYKYPYIFYFELKEHKGNTLPFSCITDYQWDSLIKKSPIPGVIAGMLIKYSDYDEQYFIPIEIAQKLKNGGSKSVHIAVARDVGIPLIGKKVKVTYTYEINDFLDLLTGGK